MYNEPKNKPEEKEYDTGNKRFPREEDDEDNEEGA